MFEQPDSLPHKALQVSGVLQPTCSLKSSLISKSKQFFRIHK
jgi:hypothetical protein